jgi:hypothetical protein
MKKRALQFCLLIGSVIMMSVVSAKAQTQYRAHIPFNFTVGQKSYDAGDYVVDTLSPNSGIQSIAIRDANGRNAYLMTATLGEDRSRIEMATLVFDQYEMQYSLSAIRTPTFIVKFESERKTRAGPKCPTEDSCIDQEEVGAERAHLRS